MFALIKSASLAHQLNNRWYNMFYMLARNHWTKDFKPGLFPKTDEERKAAAKKYYLFPEEYEPYPDDGTGCGDYPKLPAGPDGLGIEAKDPFYPYDLPELKRNFNEALHAEIDFYGEDRYSQPAKLRFSMVHYMKWCFGSLGLSVLLFFWFEDKKMFRPVIPKQYPGKGKTHYTFQPGQ